MAMKKHYNHPTKVFSQLPFNAKINNLAVPDIIIDSLLSISNLLHQISVVWCSMGPKEARFEATS